MSRYSANAPASAPITVGSAYPGDAPCLVTAAAIPRQANKASPAYPRASRRAASTPTSIAYRKTTTNTPASSTVLSFVPNVEVAQTFTGSGVWLIATDPTSITGDAAGTDSPQLAAQCPWPARRRAARRGRPSRGRAQS